MFAKTCRNAIPMGNVELNHTKTFIGFFVGGLMAVFAFGAIGGMFIPHGPGFAFSAVIAFLIGGSLGASRRPRPLSVGKSIAEVDAVEASDAIQNDNTVRISSVRKRGLLILWGAIVVGGVGGGMLALDVAPNAAGSIIAAASVMGLFGLLSLVGGQGLRS